MSGRHIGGTADEQEYSGIDSVGPGFMMPEVQKSHRTVKVTLPIYPTAQGTPRKTKPPMIIVDVDADGSNLNVELTVEGPIHTPEEYIEVMKLLSNLV